MTLSTKDLPLVSVIIPAYNHEQYIQETIYSVILQQYENIELLVIDDGSQDETWEKIVEMHTKHAPSFSLFSIEKQENQGTCATLNTFIARVNGKYTLLLASDDVLEPNAIAEFVAFLENEPQYGLVVGKNSYIDTKGQLLYRKQCGEFTYKKEEAFFTSYNDYLMKTESRVDFFSKNFGSYTSLVQGNYIPNGYLIRTSLLHEIPRFSHHAPLEDWYLHLQLAKITKFKFLNIPSFKYRIHATNTSYNTEKMIEMSEKTRKHEFSLLIAYNDRTHLKIFTANSVAFSQKSNIVELLQKYLPKKTQKNIKKLCSRSRNAIDDVLKKAKSFGGKRGINKKIKLCYAKYTAIGKQLRNTLFKSLFINFLIDIKSLLYINEERVFFRNILSCICVVIFNRASITGGRVFDPQFYKILYNKKTFLRSTLLHYIFYGEKEGNFASKFFSPNYYMTHNAISINTLSPMVHYLLMSHPESEIQTTPIAKILLEYKNTLSFIDVIFNTNNYEVNSWACFHDTNNIFFENEECYLKVKPYPLAIKEHVTCEIEIVNVRKHDYTRLNSYCAYGIDFIPSSYVKKGLDSFIAIFNDVYVVGGSTLIFDKNGNQYYDALSECMRKKDCVLMSPFSGYGQEIKSIVIFKTKQVIDKAIILTHELDFNYYHNIIENVSRLTVLFEENEYLDYPIIMTNGLHENMYAAVKTLFPQNDIIKIEKTSAVRVKKAVYVAPCCCIYEQKQRWYKNSMFRQDILRIRALANAILLKSLCSFPTYSKIYISRLGYERSILNEEKIISYLEQNGFTILDTGKLSFAEQVHIFSHAEVVISASGSAMTNIIFCKPETKVIVLAASCVAKMFHFWAGLGTAASANLFLCTFGKKNTITYMSEIHNGFFIDIDDFKKYLSEII